MNRRGFLSTAMLIGVGAVLNRSTPTSRGTPNASSVPISRFPSSPTWQQNFASQSGPAVDTAVWRYELDPVVPTYNREEQAYTADPANIRVEPGCGVVIEARRQGYRYPGDPDPYYEYTSARIDTKGRFDFEYGKIEATMQLPAGSGTWAAFWLLSANTPNTARYKNSPTFDPNVYESRRFYMKDGELDIMEQYGVAPGEIEGTAHSFQRDTEVRVAVADYADRFHVYGIEVTPSAIVWTLDGKPYGRFVKPSDDTDAWPIGNGNRFYPIINLAMGGGTKGNFIDRSTEPRWRLTVRDVSFFDYLGG